MFEVMLDQSVKAYKSSDCTLMITDIHRLKHIIAVQIEALVFGEITYECSCFPLITIACFMVTFKSLNTLL